MSAIVTASMDLYVTRVANNIETANNQYGVGSGVPGGTIKKGTQGVIVHEGADPSFRTFSGQWLRVLFDDRTKEVSLPAMFVTRS